MCGQAGGDTCEQASTAIAPADDAQPADALTRVRLNRARALACARDHCAAAAAYSDLEAAGRLAGQTDAWLCYGHALANAGKPQQAEAALMTVLQESPPAQVRFLRMHVCVHTRPLAP